MRHPRKFSWLAAGLIAALVVALLPALPAAAAGGKIDYGDTVSGEISNAKYFDLWEFTGSKGDAVQITMLGSGGLDPYLGLIEGKSEMVLAEDDDSAGDTNAYIELVLPSSGTFMIVATRYDLEFGQTAGSYTLELQDANAPQTTVISDQPGGGTEVEPGVFYMGELAPETVVYDAITDDVYARLYEFEVTKGDELLVGMFADGSSLDAYLMVADENGDFLAEDDDSGHMVDGDKYDAFVSLTVPSTGSYVIVATRSGLDTGRTSGDYALMAAVESGEPIEVVEEPEPTEPDPNANMPEGTEYVGDIQLDAPVTGELDDDLYLQVYSFDGEAGQEVTITMTGDGTLDAYLGVMDPADEIIAEDNDSAGGTDAQIALRLPEAGEYLILATRDMLDAGKSSGSYTLEITEALPEPEEPEVSEEPESTVGGFGGLPGRSLTSEEGTFYLRGSGASDDPAKNTPLEAFASGASDLPGRGGLGDLRPMTPGRLNFEEIKVTFR